VPEIDSEGGKGSYDQARETATSADHRALHPQTARSATVSNSYACSVFSAIGVGSSGEWLRWDRDSMMSAPPCYSSTSVANCSTAA
jgi:hypothetical protein